MELHPRFDLECAIGRFPLHELRKAATERDRERALEQHAAGNPGARPRRPYVPTPGGEIVTSPYDLAIVEQIRDEVFAGIAPPGEVAVDVFVFGVGAPPARHLTAIGGVPFRSRRKPWPTTQDGRPCLFIGQLSFVDSADLFPELPAEVLLVFVDPSALRRGRDAYLFEWVSLDESDLVTASDVPEITYTTTQNPFRPDPDFRPTTRAIEILPCYGVVHRTLDYPDVRERFAAFKQPWLLSSLEATKIGGIPRYVQRAPALARRFLAAIASIQPAAEVPFPWDNQATPISMRDVHRLPTLKFGDMGSLYLHRDVSGAISGEAQGY